MNEQILECRDIPAYLCAARVRDALNTLEEGQALEVYVDDAENAAVLERLCALVQAQCEKTEEGHGLMLMTITPSRSLGSVDLLKANSLIDRLMKESAGREVLVLSSSRMGQGNPRLGEALLVSFFHQLEEREDVPGTIVLYNAGCVLACEDSPILNSLKALEDRGIDIAISNQSLEFYRMENTLSVGRAVDMEEMIQILMRASKTISI